MKRLFKKETKKPYEIYNFDNSSTGIYQISIPAGIGTADFYGISGGAGGGGAFVSKTGIGVSQCNDWFLAIGNGAAYSSTAGGTSFNMLRDLITDVIYNGSGTYLVSCNNGILYKSTDELSTFQRVSSPTTKNIISLLWHNNQYFVYNSDFDIWRSSDLITWTQGARASVNGSLNSYDGKITISPVNAPGKYSLNDGQTWTTFSGPGTGWDGPIGYSTTFNKWYCLTRFGLHYSSSYVGAAWTNLGVWGNDISSNETTFLDVNRHFYLRFVGGSYYTSTGLAFTATSNPFKWIYHNGNDYTFMNGSNGQIFKSSSSTLGSATLLNNEYQNIFVTPIGSSTNNLDGQLTIGNNKVIIHGFQNVNNNGQTYNIFSYRNLTGDATSWTGIGVQCLVTGATGTNPGIVRVGTGYSGGAGGFLSGGGAGGFSGVGGTAANAYETSGSNGSGLIAGGGGGGGSGRGLLYHRGGTGGGFSLSDITFSTLGIGTAGVGNTGYFSFTQNAQGSVGVGQTTVYGGGGNTYNTTNFPDYPNFTNSAPWRALQSYGSAWGDRFGAISLKTKYGWQSLGNWTENATLWKCSKINNSNEILTSSDRYSFVITPSSHASNTYAGTTGASLMDGAKSGIGTYVIIGSASVASRISIGSTWSSLTNVGFTDLSPFSITFDTVNDKFIAVGSGTTYPIWTANNNGTGWTASTSVVSGSLQSIVSLGTTSLTVGTAGSAYYSTNGGTSWTRIVFPSTTLCAAAGTSNFVVTNVGVSTGIWISTDATATTWTRRSWKDLFPNNSVFPTDSTSMTVYGISHSGTYYGIFVSSDECGRWLWSDDGNQWYVGNDVGIPTSLSATSGSRGTVRLLFYPK